jgi:ceramide glucosyltransferase
MCLSFVTVIFGYFQFYNWKPVNIQRDLPGVSIIKPIVGKDAKLKENLESYFKLNYPKYEILICIGEASNPPSLPLIQELMDTYPLVDVRLFIGAKSVGVNPKINNMITAYESAQYELIWISDANILSM